jgi:hypothetical protein
MTTAQDKMLANYANLQDQVKDLREANKRMRAALKPFADRYRERMLEDTPISFTNGQCRAAKEAMA